MVTSFADIFGMDGIIVLIVVLVLLFGGAAIPKLARNLGSAQNEFKKGMSDGHKESAQATQSDAARIEAAKTEAARLEAAKIEAEKLQAPSDSATKRD